MTVFSHNLILIKLFSWELVKFNQFQHKELIIIKKNNNRLKLMKMYILDKIMKNNNKKMLINNFSNNLNKNNKIKSRIRIDIILNKLGVKMEKIKEFLPQKNLLILCMVDINNNPHFSSNIKQEQSKITRNRKIKLNYRPNNNLKLHI